MIYYISDGEYVKIGYTGGGEYAVKVRLSQCQVGNARRLALAGYHEGGREVERALHLTLKALHVRGEWFAAVGPLAWCQWNSDVPRPKEVPYVELDHVLDSLEADVLSATRKSVV